MSRDEWDDLRARALHAAALTLELAAARLELAATRIDARRTVHALAAAARDRVERVLWTHPDLGVASVNPPRQESPRQES